MSHEHHQNPLYRSTDLYFYVYTKHILVPLYMIYIYIYYIHMYCIYIYITYDNQSLLHAPPTSCPFCLVICHLSPKGAHPFSRRVEGLQGGSGKVSSSGCADVSWAQAMGVRCWEMRRSWWNTTAMRQGAMAWVERLMVEVFMVKITVPFWNEMK